MDRDAGIDISVVIPSCNEEGNVAELARRLGQALAAEGDYEIIFVDDGSTDGTLAALRELRAADRRIAYISFSRNFGHQAAIRAGLERARGECAIMLDADLQHPPELLPLLLAKWREGYEVVNTVREEDPRLPWGKRAGSRLFYRLVGRLGEIPIREGCADFRLVSKRVAALLSSLPEGTPFYRGLVPWLGFRQAEIGYSPAERLSGVTKYGFRRMFRFALAGITSFSVKPLHLTTALGACISVGAFAYAAYALAIRAFTDRTVPGWTSILISVLLIGGIQLVCLGIIGEYLGKLFMDAKRRPHYVVAEEAGCAIAGGAS